MYYSIESENKNDYREYTEYIQNPSLTIKEFKQEIKYIDDFASINQLTDYYFKSLDTVDKYRYRLRFEIIKNDFVEYYVPSNILGLNGAADSLSKLFKTYTGDEVAEILGLDYFVYEGRAKLVRIEDVVYFIKKIAQRAKRYTNTYTHNEYITIEKLKDLFINFNIDYFEIFGYIFEGKLNIYLDKLEICKTANMYVCKDEAYILLLDRALKKLKKDDS